MKIIKKKIDKRKLSNGCGSNKNSSHCPSGKNG